MSALLEPASVKPCSKCRTLKSADQFYLVNGKRESRCKDCENARRRHRDHIRYTAVSDITPEQELAMRKRARRCPMPGCGVKLTDKPGLPSSKHLDHILPIGAGGTHTHGNVRIICADCNLKRPKDGSDFTGQITLWAQAPAVVSRPDGRKDGGNANTETCRKGLHPWIPANIKVTGSGKKLCNPCHQAKEVRRGKQGPLQQCKCGAMFPAPGRTFLCPGCMMAIGARIGELHASGMSYREAGLAVGYQSHNGVGASHAARRSGYIPAARPAQPKPSAPADRLRWWACPDCGQPTRAARGSCEPCTAASVCRLAS